MLVTRHPKLNIPGLWSDKFTSLLLLLLLHLLLLLLLLLVLLHILISGISVDHVYPNLMVDCSVCHCSSECILFFAFCFFYINLSSLHPCLGFSSYLYKVFCFSDLRLSRVVLAGNSIIFSVKARELKWWNVKPTLEENWYNRNFMQIFSVYFWFNENLHCPVQKFALSLLAMQDFCQSLWRQSYHRRCSHCSPAGPLWSLPEKMWVLNLLKHWKPLCEGQPTLYVVCLLR